MLVFLACDSGPLRVFVPTTEPEVVIVVRASATEVSVGDPVVLFAERWNRGEWKLVARKKLAPQQCWLRHPPSQKEKEVADNLRWQAFPSEGARLNTDFRADHTRVVFFEEPGTYILESSSKIWCVPEKIARGKPIKIAVHEHAVPAKTNR